MNQNNKKRIIVVIGMHRSGTSAIARGIQALGVDLNNRLMPPVPSNNEKGFFEDIEINRLNDGLLNILNCNWHALSIIPPSAFEQENLEPFKLRAIELMRDKIGDQIFGFKDPRTSRLLPFWRVVFNHLNVSPSYIIAIRHPMSVMQSLKRRDGYDNEKSYYLWLEHILPTILETADAKRVVVDYDLLMADPQAQLERILIALGLPFISGSSDVKDYISEFLDETLRHTQYKIEDLDFDPTVPLDVINAYKLLKQLARDEINIDGHEVMEIFGQLNYRLQSLSPALNYMTRLERKMTERDGQIANLNQTLSERDNQIADLNQTLSEHDGQITNLKQAVAEIHESTSWRLTSPVRLVGHQLLRIKIVLKALPYALSKCGGYRKLINHIWSTYKKEGINGIKYRVLLSASSGAPPHVMNCANTNRNDYNEWVCRYDTLTDIDRDKIKTRINHLHKLPLISVVMPVYNPPLKMLEDAIRSVQDQLYPNWELCIADDASTEAGVHKLLQQYADKDSRIKVVFREKNGHISAASNSALELANGEYIALLDNDDLLAEHALFCVAQTITDHPDAEIIYSDEDKIDQSGRRYDPYFKSDWNPELFLSHNMISHLGVYQADLVRKIEGFREGFEGSQDYDLALRCIEQIKPTAIYHIPHVLYHWRSHPGSTALSGSEKNYALLAGTRALNEHFIRAGVSGKAELLDFGMYRARYEILQPVPMVSLIIPTYNGLNLIKKCVDSIVAKTTFKNYEIIIVDNNSDDVKTLEYFTSLAGNNRIRVLRDERPFNYSALNNDAILHARGEYLGLINNDIEVITPQWLDEMMSLATQHSVGAVGARLWYPDDTLQHGGIILGINGLACHSFRGLPKGHIGYFGRTHLIQTLSAVTAACLVIKKSIYQEVGGLDEINFKVAFNDVDFCLRVREAGYRNIWTPYAELYHNESATRGPEDNPEKKKRFAREVHNMKKRWGDQLLNDPAYNPNLTLDREDFSLAWPPRVKPI